MINGQSDIPVRHASMVVDVGVCVYIDRTKMEICKTDQIISANTVGFQATFIIQSQSCIMNTGTLRFRLNLVSPSCD